MPTVRVLIVPSMLTAVVVMCGCNSKQPVPAPVPPQAKISAPDPAAALAAAKELAIAAAEKYREVQGRLELTEKLLNRAIELGDQELVDKVSKQRDRQFGLSLEAKAEWSKAKDKVKELAKEVLR